MDVPLKNVPMVTATLEQQSTRCGNVGFAQLLLSRESVECLQVLWGPGFTLYLDGQAALALVSIEIKDMCTEGGEELVFRVLDQRFPDKVAADRVGEAVGLKIMNK